MIIFNDQIIIVLIIYLLCKIFGKLETINLIFWLGLLVYYINYQKRHYIRKVKDKKYIYYGLIIGVISIIMAFNSGYFIGFVKSPFKHNLISIVKNSCQLLIPIVGIELTRNILINKYKYNKLSRVLITILLILLEVNYKISFNGREEIFKYICADIIPLIASNILYSYMVYQYSISLPLFLRLLDVIVLIFLPQLPCSNWYILGCMSLIKIIILYGFLKCLKAKDKRKKYKSFAIVNYAFVLLLVTSLVAFMLGLFKYKPVVILSNSMTPLFKRGDIVIYEDVDPENLKIGNIVLYTKNGKNIIHRIVKITSDGFITKGDANNTVDDKIKEGQIKGRYLGRVKYLGMPSVWLYEFIKGR